jgi:hypothetical protein
MHQRISHLQGFPDAILGFHWGEHKGSDPDHRALHSIIQNNIFHDDLLSDLSSYYSRPFAESHFCKLVFEFAAG